MQIVGDRLSELARTEKKGDQVDAFARSAFNRYYYAAFLTTREMLRTLNTNWTRTPHAAIPELLNGQVFARIKMETSRQWKSGELTRKKSIQMKTEAKQAAAKLADLLRIANHIRVVADYLPEEELLWDGDTFKLSGQTISAASRWSRYASMHAGILLKVWRNLGLS